MDPAFAHEFFDVARAQWVGDIPADACQNNILWEMDPLEAHSHQVIEQELPKDPFLRGKVMLDVVRWDDPNAPATMEATLTP
jgi:hypothetical protein